MQNWKDRQGVWVECNEGVGIRVVETVDVSGRAVPVPYVHLSNADGTTLAQLPESSCTNVRQARAASIPASRIGHLTVEQLARLGYV